MLGITGREGGREGARYNVDDRFYVSLFSALEQTHCAFVNCRM